MKDTIRFFKKKEKITSHGSYPHGCGFLDGKGPPSLPSNMYKNRSMLKQVMVKFQNDKKKEKVLRASRKKKQVSIKK